MSATVTTGAVREGMVSLSGIIGRDRERSPARARAAPARRRSGGAETRAAAGRIPGGAGADRRAPLRWRSDRREASGQTNPARPAALVSLHRRAEDPSFRHLHPSVNYAGATVYRGTVPGLARSRATGLALDPRQREPGPS